MDALPLGDRIRNMYIPIGKKSNGRGLELSHLGEWVDSAYSGHSIVGFDILVTIGYPIHLLALSIVDNHIALCMLNFQAVLFWKN